ncbi:MAG TPA: ABC transporter ATP-binding protein [Vicinamibacteria bacterium]|nr:ABC transporter ATP-binding protein [Vicinamibacteria bacterium]
MEPEAKRGDVPESQASQPPILVAQDLSRSYGPRQAVRGLSFSLNAGRILGFLGPNGAGKTTSIRILTTILEPSTGSFAVAGIDHRRPEEIRRRIGVLPENLGFPRQMTGLEYLSFFGQLYGRGAGDARSLALALLEDVGLKERGRSLIGTYSHGMRQRLGIARALVNDPAVVFLDEPTLGLDPRGQQELLGLVRRIARDRNAGVIMCSHLLWEIEKICDDVVILSAGQVIVSGSVRDVIGRSQRGGIRVTVPPASLAEAQRVLEAAPEVTNVAPVPELPGCLRMDPANAGSAQDHALNNKVLEGLIRTGIPILGFGTEGGRLEEVFLQLTDKAIK